MPTLSIETWIDAPIERCFDLARSIDFHITSATRTQETVIAGRTSGLIELGESVTWRARHLGARRTLTVVITAMSRPTYFQDTMSRGDFSMMQHDHFFDGRDGRTMMRDVFAFRSPLGLLGLLFDHAFLRRYMRRFLLERARLLKATAESDAWRRYLGSAEPEHRA